MPRRTVRWSGDRERVITDFNILYNTTQTSSPIENIIFQQFYLLFLLVTGITLQLVVLVKGPFAVPNVTTLTVPSLSG